jgi:hypothetical protein
VTNTELVPLRSWILTKLKALGVREATVPKSGISYCPKCSGWSNQPMSDPVTGVVVSCWKCERPMMLVCNTCKANGTEPPFMVPKDDGAGTAMMVAHLKEAHDIEVSGR